MNPEIKAKWIAALRSGEYVQHQGCLRTTRSDTPNAFCCLGVLTDLYVNEHEVNTYSWEVSGSVQGNCMTLSPDVYGWAGLDGTSPTVLYPAPNDDFLHTEHLAVLNDSGGYDFERLANLIEAQL